jgi:hypothetical protein
MVHAQPVRQPQVAPAAHEWATVDTELAPWFAKLAKRLNG